MQALARSPGYLEAHLTALRALVDPFGQREVMVDRLGLLEAPTLVVWGERDRVFPRFQAKRSVACLREGSLALIPNCGHMPHVEVLITSCQPSKGSSPNGCVVDQGRPDEVRGYPGKLYQAPKPVSF